MWNVSRILRHYQVI
ncbi:BnaC05g31780D [Brassica napus]|uniref:BnaC05g31780D protein n=1 Tax=Brassica napus TaxID=3708 RepID=A0A078GX83_BRANA|nr:BnaC05g31780D [Brassica napus]